MGKRTGKNLDPDTIIQSKCHPAQGTREQVWCGCLQPAEAVALVEAGYWPTTNPEYLDSDMEWLYNKVRSGESNPGWFYFEPKPRKKKWRRKGSVKAKR